ncbi:MAG: peptide chain release factor N(5)-glutamine methyltransferase [Clostridiales bacterium]|nr:peptide chain release factor N(5)-glutamine methyltransferase [Clostridiales bacterium]
MRYKESLKQVCERLEKAGIPEPDWDAWYLFSHAAHMNRAAYFMKQAEEMPSDEELELERLTQAREKRIPLQHLLGQTEFMGFPFQVDGRVLVPRQDTEKLVELVLEDQKNSQQENTRLLDMCTGSGCIAVSLALLGEFSEVVAVDISEDALKVARENARINECSKIEFRQSNLFEALEGEQFEMIVSNPPYIPTGELDHLMPEVRDHDPWLALDGKEDGLYFYRRLAEECPRHLVPGGKIFWEIGCDQGEAVKELLQEAGFSDVKILPDDTGKDRVIIGDWLCLTD